MKPLFLLGRKDSELRPYTFQWNFERRLAGGSKKEKP